MRKITLDKIQRILIVKMSSIGDVIHGLPTLAVLHKHFPQAHIAWAVEPKAYDIVRAHPNLDEVLCLDLDAIGQKLKKPATFLAGIRAIQELALKIRAGNYDLVLDLQGLLKSGLVSCFSQAPFRLVYSRPREGSALFATHLVPTNPDSLHAVEKYLDVLRYLGLTIEKGDEEKFILTILPEDEKFVEEFFWQQAIKESEMIIGLNPGAAWRTKQWPSHHFAALADLLIEKYGCRIMIFGGPGDRTLVEQVASEMKHPAIIAGGKTTLKQLAALIKKCQVFVGNDTGPLHLAIAVQTPVVALFGPTSPTLTGPYGSKQIVLSKNLPCAPCFKAKKCPQGSQVNCLESIQPEEVLQAVENFL